MMLEPPIDDLVKKVGNPYVLAVMAGKRARFLQTVLSEEERVKESETSRAIDEINEGKIIQG